MCEDLGLEVNVLHLNFYYKSTGHQVSMKYSFRILEILTQNIHQI